MEAQQELTNVSTEQSGMIKMTMDGQEVSAVPGETILQAATRAGICIPTMCYLTKLRPIASCRLCVVEVQGVSGFVLSCQAPVKEEMVVLTQSDELYEHRQNIMKFYDVNHPLECGVCDKSGECELQNRTLEFGVDAQTFSAREQQRKIRDWGVIQYDPNLCILCERCVHTCNEVIGDDAIEIRFGGYGSGIVPKGSEKLDCTMCGECIAVCPVGALVSTDFKYRSNAWELQKVPAACAHCSSACAINYEVKHDSVQSAEEKIYRVTNDFHFASLCGAGRFGFNYANTDQGKDEAKIQAAITAFEKADTVRFDSTITNEEALILQKMKEKRGYKLINPEAKAYQDFLHTFSQSSGTVAYEGNLGHVKNSDCVICVGSRIVDDQPMVRYAINQAQKIKNAYFSYLHPMSDERLIVNQHIKYEVGAEEGVMALLTLTLLADSKLPEATKKYLDSIDVGYVASESNVNEEELEQLHAKLARRKQKTLVIGSDLYAHPRAENMAKLLGLIERHTDFQAVLIPPSTNALGVALICDLDETPGSYTIGYNQLGDFVLSSFGDGDLSIPAPNQQEGTFTNIDKRVVPTNAALHFDGYELNDIANALGMTQAHTIDYTEELPESRGFQKVAFDDLPNGFKEDGSENRGYCLSTIIAPSTESSLEEIADISEMNGTILYACNPVMQFNRWTGKSAKEEEKNLIYGSEQFALAAKVQDGDRVEVAIGQKVFPRVFKKDAGLRGTVGIISDFDATLSERLLPSGYRYFQARINKHAEQSNG